ncbi:hypothetical protein [Kitasatospora sp. NPDC093102]|uniref:hypothetical protein n=1 Tax=Kitasatospora sp. NPDC093102 TaxID=3155069 RepID=UPI00341D223E
MNASVIARIAKIVPLAVVAAVGVAACGPTNGGASVAASAPASTPAVASSATPGAGAVPAPLTPAPTTPAAAAPAAPISESAPPAAGTPAAAAAKSGAKPAAKAPAKAAPAKPVAPKAAPAQSGGSGIDITFGGLDEGGRIELNDLVSFSVTWKNNDATGTRSVAPVVATQQYEGALCGRVVAMAEGTLERKDASGWKTLPGLSQGTGMDYATGRNDAAFTLAPGESRTIEYRMRLSSANRPGRLAIEADAPVPNSTDFGDMAKAVVHVSVVDRHSPEVLSVMPPAKGVIGTFPMTFGYRVSSPDGTADLRPLVTVTDPRDNVTADDFTVEAKVGEEWKPVDVREGCDGPVAVATGTPGVRDGDAVEYTLRVTFKKTPKDGGDVDIRVGAESYGHQAALRSVFGRN